MRKIFLVVIAGLVMSCSDSGKEENKEKEQNDNENNVHSETNHVNNGIKMTADDLPALLEQIKADVKDKESFIKNIKFPLKGEWSILLGLEEKTNEITQEKFADGYSALFSEVVIDSIQSLTMDDVNPTYNKTDESLESFQFCLTFPHDSEDGQNKEEWSTCLLFSVHDGKYELVGTSGVSFKNN